jgi:hypothetical protein
MYHKHGGEGQAGKGDRTRPGDKKFKENFPEQGMDTVVWDKTQHGKYFRKVYK